MRNGGAHQVCVMPLTECRKIGYAFRVAPLNIYDDPAVCVHAEHTEEDIIIRLASRFIDLINFST